METIDKYELSLRDITTNEYSSHLESYSEYKEIAVKLLSSLKLFVFEEDVTLEQEEEEHFSEHPDRYVIPEIPFQKRKGKLTKAWYDVWIDYQIKPEDLNYDIFFVFKMRHHDLLELDAFLNYQLENCYESNSKQFIRFLKLTLRKHNKKLLQPEQTETINEWVAEKEKETTLSGTPDAKTKGKIKRGRDDNVTKLNQEQTALLIHYLKAGKIILKDEYLKPKEAGQAFSILTGYSADSLRQNLSEAEIKRISIKKNIDAVANALTSIQLLIPKEIKDKK